MTVPEDLELATSRAWLSAVLGEPVHAVTVGALDVRVSTNVPLKVVTTAGRRELWLKGYFGEDGAAAQPAGLSEASG